MDGKLLETSPEVLQGWQTILGPDGSRLQNAHAKILFRRIRDNLTHVLGWPPHLSSTPPHYAFHLATKARYPDKVIAVRTADHYNFVGIDAVIVCEKLDLKGEGIATLSSGDHHCPEARVSAQNATSDFHRLCVEHKLDVVVCECKPDKTRGRPERFVQQICTPHSPLYFFGASKLPVTAGPDEMAVVGLSWSKVGWEVHRWESAARTHRRWLGLHFDGVKELLDVLQVAPPVYLRVDALGAPGGPRGELAELRSTLRHRFPGIFRVIKEVPDAPAAGPSFQGLVQQLLDGRADGEGGGDADGASQAPLAEDTWLDVDVDTGDRPMHLFQSTAYNLGINLPKAARMSDVPSLSQHILPGAQHGGEAYDQAVHSKLNALLLQPPSAQIAAEIREAIRFLWHSSDPSLKFETTRSFERISLLLHQEPGARERGGVNVFRELHRLLHCTRTALTFPEMAPFVDRVLRIASSPTGLGFSVDKELLRADCSDMCESIEAIVQLRPPLYASPFTQQDAALRNLDYLFRYYEHDRFDALYKRQSLPGDAVPALERARSAFVAAVARFIAGPVAAADSRMCLKWHPKERMVSFFSLKFNAGKEGRGFLPFEGRSGSTRGKKGSFLTPEVKEAQDAYLRAIKAAQAAARQRLDALSARIVEPRRRGDCSQRSQFASIVAAKEVNELGKLLTGVAHKTFALGWTIPQLTAPGSSLRLEQVWPFWMPSPGAAGAGTVTNDVDLRDEMFVLSGPNMSGKSTIMRTLVATALLANVGLPVPARAASVPQYKSFLFRNFIGDSPVEGRSGFALESKEMGIVLRLDESMCLAGPAASGNGARSAAPPTDGRDPDQPRHFICIDEFGKGTEDDCASAICAAALLHFDKGRFNGVFATHQHALFDPELRLFSDTAGAAARLRRTRLMRMVVDEAPPEGAFFRDVGARAFRSRFSLAPGQDTRSLALQVAHEQGMDASVLRRAQQWQLRLAAVSAAPIALDLTAPHQQHVTAARGAEDGASDFQPQVREFRLQSSAVAAADESACLTAEGGDSRVPALAQDAWIASSKPVDVYARADGAGDAAGRAPAQDSRGGESSGRPGAPGRSGAGNGARDVPAFIRNIRRQREPALGGAALRNAASGSTLSDNQHVGPIQHGPESCVDQRVDASVRPVGGRDSDSTGAQRQRRLDPTAAAAAGGGRVPAPSTSSQSAPTTDADVPDFIRRIGRVNQPLFSGVAPVGASALHGVDAAGDGAAALSMENVAERASEDSASTPTSSGADALLAYDGSLLHSGSRYSTAAAPDGRRTSTETTAAGSACGAAGAANYGYHLLDGVDVSPSAAQLLSTSDRDCDVQSHALWPSAEAEAFKAQPAAEVLPADAVAADDDGRRPSSGVPGDGAMQATAGAAGTREMPAPVPSIDSPLRSWPLTWPEDDGPRLEAVASAEPLSRKDEAAGKWASSWWPAGDFGAGSGARVAWGEAVEEGGSFAADGAAWHADSQHDAPGRHHVQQAGHSEPGARGGTRETRRREHSLDEALAAVGGDAADAVEAPPAQPAEAAFGRARSDGAAAAATVPADLLDLRRQDAAVPPPPPPSAWTIDAAARVMHDTVSRVLTSALEPSAAAALPMPPPKLTVMDVQRGFRPPAAAQLCSTVYMLEIEFEGAAAGGGTRAFYVGESDNFVSRFRSHVRTYDRPRAKPRSVLRSAAFVLLNQQGAAPLGKSLARKMESAVIQELDRLNCPLFSTQDGRHKSFGSAT